jgi:hypothetical protein
MGSKKGGKGLRPAKGLGNIVTLAAKKKAR